MKLNSSLTLEILDVRKGEQNMEKKSSLTWLKFLLIWVWIYSNCVYGQATAVSKKAYPPYPDVWDWVVPQHIKNVGFRLQRLDDGDVQIVYEDQTKLRDNRRPVFSTYFFDQRQTRSQVLPTNNSLIAGQQSYDVKLKNGLEVKGSMGPGLRSNRCYDRLNGKITVTDSTNKTQEIKTLFIVFDKPRLWRVTEACKGMDGPDVFSFQVESVFAEILPLEDDTFLVIDSLHGILIRFDSSFQTKSTLINNRLFLMNTKSFEEFWRNNFRDDELDKLQQALYRKFVSRN